MLTAAKQRISSLVATFTWALVGLTAAAGNAAILEAITVTSDNPSVLTVTTNPDGTYTVTVVGPGTANLIVVTAEDIPNGIPSISESFPFEIYDASQLATHFAASITGIVEKPDAADTGATATGATAAADTVTGAATKA